RTPLPPRAPPFPYTTLFRSVAAMESRAAAIADGSASELVWLLEHPPLYTAGSGAQDADLIDAARFPVFRTGRGGQHTYHGPGQRDRKSTRLNSSHVKISYAV